MHTEYAVGKKAVMVISSYTGKAVWIHALYFIIGYISKHVKSPFVFQKAVLCVVSHSRLGLPAQQLARHYHKTQIWGVGPHLPGFNHPSSVKRGLCFEPANDSKILHELIDFWLYIKTQVPLPLPKSIFKIKFYAPTWFENSHTCKHSKFYYCNKASFTPQI